MTSLRCFVSIALFLSAAPAIVACGAADSSLGAAPPGGPDAAPPPPESSWKTLVSGEWTQRPGSEGYSCVRQTVDEDLFANEFEAINPLGTHHTLLTMGDPNGPDGAKSCSASENRPLDVFSSGVGTDPLKFPDGVALRIRNGTQLLLNLHLFNTSTEPLSGVSGTRVRTIPESAVLHEAEGLLAGTVRLDIPAGQTTRHVGYCTMKSDVTLFAVAPHMHQLGVYEKVVAEIAATGETVLYDAPYDFNEQSFKLIEPLKLAKGDRVRVECTHNNTTNQRVTFGESTLSEMCFAGLFRYPAEGGYFVCSDP